MLELTWWDAYAYAKWRGRDLPSEQEWEKAARGTKGFQYPWGEEPSQKLANTGEDHKPGQPGTKGQIDGYNFWGDVDSMPKDKSAYGVIGMAGNVSEWTRIGMRRRPSPSSRAATSQCHSSRSAPASTIRIPT